MDTVLGLILKSFISSLVSDGVRAAFHDVGKVWRDHRAKKEEAGQ